MLRTACLAASVVFSSVVAASASSVTFEGQGEIIFDTNTTDSLMGIVLKKPVDWLVLR